MSISKKKKGKRKLRRALWENSERSQFAADSNIQIDQERESAFFMSIFMFSLPQRKEKEKIKTGNRSRVLEEGKVFIRKRSTTELSFF